MRASLAGVLALCGLLGVGCNHNGNNNQGDTGGGGDADPGDSADDADDAGEAGPACSTATDCASCADLPSSCGWCNGRCVDGTETASNDGMCTGDQWLYRWVQCPGMGAQCAGYTDCTSCAMDPDHCGWCANTMRCTAGDRAGPAQTTSGCSPDAGTWIYNLEMQTCP